jgi:enolase
MIAASAVDSAAHRIADQPLVEGGHLAVGLGGGQLKVGSFQRSERMVKWNECLRIQDELGADAFVGGRPLGGTWWARNRQTSK